MLNPALRDLSHGWDQRSSSFPSNGPNQTCRQAGIFRQLSVISNGRLRFGRDAASVNLPHVTITMPRPVRPLRLPSSRLRY
jgi:hypothetical protein